MIENKIFRSPDAGQDSVGGNTVSNEEVVVQSKNNENLDWKRMEEIKSEISEIFSSLNRYLDQTQAITEIAKDRNFIPSIEIQNKSNDILKKFEPYGEYQKPLRQMISDLMSIGTMAFNEGLLIKEDELISKLNEIKNRKKV